MNSRNLICLLLIYTIWLNLFAPFASAQNILPPAASQDIIQSEPKGLQFRIREAAQQIEKPKISKSAPTQNLSKSETNAILKRLPALKTDEADKSSFALRSTTLPPPKTGKIIPTNFPADMNLQNAPNVVNANSTALEVVRFSPAGDVPLVSDLSVTFSQPMIAVTSQTEASENVPVKLTPEVKGHWRWLGTKTLLFDAETRFPMATKFVATIPAGTKSAIGGILPKEISWTFSTSSPKIEGFKPSGETVRREALLLASFNQEINAEIILNKVSATVDKRNLALRLASQDEIAADNIVGETIKNLQPNRFIIFRAINLLPPDSQITVTFGKDLPSAEGSLTTAIPQNYSFKTFSTLKLDNSYCSYEKEERECKPYENWQIKFNNPLDKESFDKSQVKIEPNIENAQILVFGNTIEITGYKKTRSDYKVQIASSLKDEFGQTLEKDVLINFKVGAAEASLFNRGGDFVVLDPNAKPEFSVYSTNYSSLRVKIYAVKPEDYQTFQAFKKEGEFAQPTFGKIVFDKLIPIKSLPDEQSETRIDISPALINNLGHAVLIVEPPGSERRSERGRIATWLEATNIGIDVFADYEKLVVSVSDLKNGKPLINVDLSLSNKAKGTTDKSGVASIELPAATKERSGVLIARRDADSAILPEDNYDVDNSDWTHKPPKDSLRWFVFNDRNMYRPGETVSIKGYVRKITSGKFTDVNNLNNAITSLDYILKDSLNNEILKGNANLNLFGAFDFKVKLPDNLNLGEQNLELMANSNLEEKEFSHNFQVQEFRRPEFEVSANIESTAPFYVGNSASIGVEAKYYSGGALPNAETNWEISAKSANYTPPNREDFTFGKFIPWWNGYYENNYDERTSQEFKGVTGDDGKNPIAIDFVSANPVRPFTLTANVSVQDVNRQTFEASTSLLVHPSELYVGIRSPKTFVQPSESFRVETITTNIDGQAVANVPVSITSVLKDWQQIKGEWQEFIADTQTCQIKSSSNAVSCDFKAKQGGVYTVTASVLDNRERRNESELSIWVAGGKTESGRGVEKESTELIPDKKEYVPNEVAEILVNSPFSPAEGILTLRRNGIIKTERFTINTTSTILHVPIKEQYLPNIHVQVDLIGATPRIEYEDERDAKLPKRPAFASGELNLNVSTASRKLSVTVEPVTKTLEPGGSTTINVAVKDKDGTAVAKSEVAVVAVDESVLALTDYKIQNPLDNFYQQIDANTTDYHSRESVLLNNPDDVEVGSGNGNGDGTGGGGGGGRDPFSKPIVRMVREGKGFIVDGQEVTNFKTGLLNQNNELPIRIRTNFDALAIFAPSVVTNADGKAIVKVKLPDNLTRYRVTAVAVTNSKQFGLGESSITAKQPLMIRPSAPRFMNFGDRIELPVVVQNQTDDPLTVDVAMRATNADLTSGNGKKIIIAANDRAEIRFPVSADRAGTARFQIGAVSGKFADAAEVELPVYTPATTEAFATYGTTDQNGAIVQPITAPQDVFPQFGGLEVTTSSTQLQELTDAYVYLQNYPFECTEQISSRIISTAALRDVLSVFDAKDLPTKPEIEAKMRADIDHLQKLQHADGGFSFWRSDDESLPFISVHVAHALARAKTKGYAVPPETLVKLTNYLRDIETKYPAWYSQETKWAISAYALYVRDLLSDKDVNKARKLLQDAGLEKLSLESVGWVLSVLANDKDSATKIDALKRHLLNRATETAGAAHFVTNYKDGEYVLLASDRRADAVILEALLKAEPNNDLIPKIVRGLLANKIKGRWSNTQENVFVLLALDQYFQTYKKQTPNFVARIWLGQSFAGEQKFTGRSADSNLTSVPMNYLQQQPTSDLILDKAGDGRLYYRIGLNYALKNLKLTAADYGFTVSRTYQAVDNATDVKQNADGSWAIKSGARVRVRIQMVAPTRRYHVALVDKLPAGFEIINPELAVSEIVPSEKFADAPNNRNYYNRNWFEYQNLRDERAEAFTSLLQEGVWNYSYVARATTPGQFVVPPAKAEEMYMPETFGRSETDFIRVE